MTHLVATIKGLFYKRPETSADPVYKFFIETKSRERKRVYNSALKRAQEDQETISNKAEKIHA
ncbi:MAG: hypothetical protein H6780_00230 [Candidatus Nomurabacteria bacterium]|nr:MAG: hypothetical protein H6780_00230 [Candidatus Nomurabacteria bacterium]